MKYSIVFLALLAAAAFCHFDFTHHKNGHELSVSIKDETSKIWVVFVEGADPNNKDLAEQNKQVKSAVKNKLVNEDVYYTEVDLTTADKQKDYAEFTKLMDIDLNRLKRGPIVALIYNKKGLWIHGHGIPQETVDTIHSFLVQKEENENRNQPISFGAPVRHPSAFASYGGGY